MIGAVQEYLVRIMEVFDETRFFETVPISKKIMVDCLLKQMDKNLESKGDFHLSEEDILNVYNNAWQQSIDEAIAQSLEEGILEITGVASNGELTYGLSESGQKELDRVMKGHVITAKFEQFGPYSPYGLN